MIPLLCVSSQANSAHLKEHPSLQLSQLFLLSPFISTPLFFFILPNPQLHLVGYSLHSLSPKPSLINSNHTHSKAFLSPLRDFLVVWPSSSHLIKYSPEPPSKEDNFSIFFNSTCAKLDDRPLYTHSYLCVYFFIPVDVH